MCTFKEIDELCEAMAHKKVGVVVCPRCEKEVDVYKNQMGSRIIECKSCGLAVYARA